MSKLTRIILASVITLGVIVGIYTSVEGASLTTARQERVGAHLVGGAMTNFDRYREEKSAPAEIQSEFEEGKGHGCESESQTSPDD